MKANGTVISKTETEHTTMQMEISIKVSGKMAGNTDKATISIQLIEAFIKAIGKTAKRKVLES